jgi:hypothetical protein
MDSGISHKLNPNPFKKDDAEKAAKPDDILVNRPGGGGRAGPAAKPDPEPLGEEQTPLNSLQSIGISFHAANGRVETLVPGKG